LSRLSATRRRKLQSDSTKFRSHSIGTGCSRARLAFRCAGHFQPISGRRGAAALAMRLDNLGAHGPSWNGGARFSPSVSGRAHAEKTADARVAERCFQAGRAALEQINRRRHARILRRATPLSKARHPLKSRPLSRTKHKRPPSPGRFTQARTPAPTRGAQYHEPMPSHICNSRWALSVVTSTGTASAEQTCK